MNKAEKLLVDLCIAFNMDEKVSNYRELKQRILAQMEEKTVVIKTDGSVDGLNYCKNCHRGFIIQPHHKHCPSCGSKIIWRLEDE